MSFDKSNKTCKGNNDDIYDDIYDDDVTNNKQLGGYNGKKESKYVNLKTNGRLFPTWVMANFNRFKLPEIFIDGSDPCNDTKISSELRKYQEFLGKYLDYNSPYRDILIYHGLGSGKTRSAINIYNVLYNYSPDWNVFILLKATLKESTWMKELRSWLQKEEKDFRMANIEFISYDAPNADKVFLEKVKNADAAKKSMYIIDESHNFINNVYTNINSKQGRRALTIYEHIIQEKKDNDGVRVVLISGSPAINIPFELALLFNLLRPDIFPKSESKFNQLYVSNEGYPTINPLTKNNFQRRIIGLVSHYIGSTPDFYAKKIVNYVDITMSEYQEYIYKHYEEIEDKIARKSRGSSGGNYKSYTRQSSNFVFPNMGQGFSGETRPRPRDFKITETDVESVTKGVAKKDEDKNKYFQVDEYIVKVNEFANAFDNFLGGIHTADTKNGYTIENDLEKINDMYPENFTSNEFMNYVEGDNKISSLLKNMYDSSAKMTFIILQIMRSPGPVLVYSNYVVMEGLQIFKIYLKYLGFSLFINPEKGKDYYRYMEYHGGIDPVERRKILEIFNRKENLVGKVCKIVMISPAGAEGISLNNIRQVHIMEPYWHEVRITQMIGRAIRQCSHRDLPMQDREVTVFRYKSVKRTASTKLTADQYIEEMARSKEGLIQSFLDSMKEVAVDCALNKTHNNLMGSYRCFQFEEKSLFDPTIGPAYKEDIYDDLKFDNGSNAPGSTTKRIKIIKIKAVKQIVENADIDNPEHFSESEFYWYNPKTLIVYDHDSQYPVGKIGTNDEDLPLKIKNDTYVITKVIPIPMIKKAQ